LSRRFLLAVHRTLLRTARTPLAVLWALGYRAAAWVYAAYLVRGERGAAAYLRGSVGTGDWLPGLADVDVAVVLDGDAAAAGAARERVARRWQALRGAVPPADLLLDYPLVLEQDELRRLAGRSALTCGRRPGYFGAGTSADGVRMLERPGLYGATADWRPLRGPERRPPELVRDAQERRVAAWLELVYWWQWAFPVCVDPSGPRTASLCVKLVCEPARIWLWLAHGERGDDRVDVLQRALRRLPEEEAALRLALDLQHGLPDSPAPPLADVLPALVRFSSRIAALLGAAVEGTTEVRLAGGDLLLAEGGWRGDPAPALLALCDWRSLAWAPRPDESFALTAGDPGDPAAVGAVAEAQEYGPYRGMRHDELLVFPSARRSRTRLRAVQCPATDPVSFALAAGRRVASFPTAPGWSARDCAGRAVAERGAWLRSSRDIGGEALGHALSAARAALFVEDPDELALTVSEAAGRLAARSTGARTVAEEALGHYRQWARHRTEPPPTVLGAARDLVLGLDAFRDSAGLLAVEP
jgi:predicted nucleotidyltransferase